MLNVSNYYASSLRSTNVTTIMRRSNSNTTMLRIDIFPPSNVVETTHSSEGQLTML